MAIIWLSFFYNIKKGDLMIQKAQRPSINHIYYYEWIQDPSLQHQ